MNTKLTIYKDNVIVKASYSLSLSESRLLLLCIGQIKSDEELNSTRIFSISVDDFSAAFNIDKASAYRRLQEVVNKLFDRYLSIDPSSLSDSDRRRLNISVNDNVFKTRWISDLSFNYESQSAVMGIAPKVVPLLSELRNGFTKYKLENVAKMTSSHAIRLYELLCQHQFKAIKEFTITPDELRTAMQLGGKHAQYGHLKTRVIAPAIKQINEHSNFTAEYATKNLRRKVIEITFSFEFKEGLEAKRDRLLKGKTLKEQGKIKNHAKANTSGTMIGDETIEAFKKRMIDEVNNKDKDGIRSGPFGILNVPRREKIINP